MIKDPFNIIVTGVGGQGNVLASLLIGAVFVEQGYKVIIGETYGASQRGGSVMSHVRVSRSRQYGPLIPPGFAHLVIALEPSEAVRVLARFGNPETICIVNTRIVQPVDVISGDLEYPAPDLLMKKIRTLGKECHFVAATDAALELGNPVLANIVLIGAAAGAGVLPISLDLLEKAVIDYMASDKFEINKKAFLTGMKIVGNSQ